MLTALKQLPILDKVYVSLLLAIFTGIILHAPFSVWMETLFPSLDLLIKSWKEILMAIAGVLLIVILWRRKQWKLLHDPVVYLVAGYAALHVALLPVFWQGVDATLAGILIDLRYILFFALVYVAMRLYPQIRTLFIGSFIAGALLVAVFSLLQVFVLPKDFLSVIGYNRDTIVPYLTVDENPDYIRITSTFRGPNPLGAYAGIVLALAAAFWLRTSLKARKVYLQKKPLIITGIIVLGSAVALWASYSRSALVAAVVAVGLVVLLTVARTFPKWLWISGFVAVFALFGGIYAARDTSFVTNVILHENEETGGDVSSNDGHAESLAYGIDRMIHQPLGGGVGSTGSASLLGDAPLIIENQYLFIAHEVGWLGLLVFMALFVLILKRLWHRRQDWLALGVFAAGIGMAIIGVLLPVWADDTVSIIWWGLAAVALVGLERSKKTSRKSSKRTAIVKET